MHVFVGRHIPWRNLLSREQLLPSHKLSLSLQQAELFAFEIAHFRGSKVVEPRDTLGGIYVVSVEFERLKSYWKDWPAFEDLAFNECGVDGPRISYWLPPLDPSKAPKKGVYAPFGYKKTSPELEVVYATAAKLAAECGECGPGGTVTLTPEALLLSVLAHPELSISQKLRDSGIDAAQVEAALRRGRSLR